MGHDARSERDDDGRRKGAPPQPGRTLRLKLHDRLLEPTAETVVCWATATDEGSTVGLRLVSAGLARRAWARMAAAAERTGARFA